MTMLPKVLLSHPGCGPFVQHAARALHEAGLLAAYTTTFAYMPDYRLCRFLATALRPFYSDSRRQLARRRITEIPEEMVIAHPASEFVRMLATKLPLGRVAADLVWEPMELWFDSIVARRHLHGVDAVYGYEHACLATFQAHKERGGLCIYDMPICHHSATSFWVRAEFAKRPELVTNYERHRVRLAARRNQRKDKELTLADRIVTASDFVADSLIAVGVPEQKIWIVPSGAPPVDTSGRNPDRQRFVFLVAGALSVRKGTHYVLEAWRRLAPPRQVELWLVGAWQLPKDLRHGLPGTVVVRDTVPREELYSLFDRANVLVFPTLAEGLALTPLQAMARGLPVITTRNSGAGVFIRHGENGWLIPPCNLEALCEAMQGCLRDPSGLDEMGRQAADAMAAWQWSDYRQALGKAVSEFLANPRPTNKSGAAAVVAEYDGQLSFK